MKSACVELSECLHTNVVRMQLGAMYWGTLAGLCVGGASGYLLVDRKTNAKKDEKTDEPDELLAPTTKVLTMLPEEEANGEMGDTLRSCLDVFVEMTKMVQGGDKLNTTAMMTDVTQNMNLATALMSQCRAIVAARNEQRPEYVRTFVQRAREWLTAMEDRAVFLRAKLTERK